MIKEHIVERFWSKVDKRGPDECWDWKAFIAKDGYGRFWNGAKKVKASRFLYQIIHGDPGSLDVCHTCDNPACVNPKHLFLGTEQDNMDDCVRKGRQYKGESHWNCKLSKSNVQKVFELRSTGMSQKDIAVAVGVNQSQISRILARKRRKHDV